MKTHYDICVVGFWYGHNYGSLLNGYAMYRIFKDMGKKVLMMQKPAVLDNDPEITEGHNVYFVEKYYDNEDISPSLPYKRLHELNKICDCFCAGSDQIWNYDLSFNENMYLPFVDENKKIISFATSFGHKIDRVPDEAKKRVKNYLQRYSAISVREQFAVDILKKNYFLDSTLVFEPVFCIDKDIYSKIADESKVKENEPYLLAYILDPTPQKSDSIISFSNKLGLKPVVILDGVSRSWEHNKKIIGISNVVPNVSTEEFLYFFRNASYVITDSFHGCAFSIIFNKLFLAIGNYNRGIERFIDLLSRVNLMGRLITNNENIQLYKKYFNSINYENVNKIIEKNVNIALKWLKITVNTPKKDLRKKGIIIPRLVNNICEYIDIEKNCTGCGTCSAICPKKSLIMQNDVNGFLRPVLNIETCIDCGICEKCCPSLHPQYKNNQNPECYAVMADDETRMVSSSGGIFTIAARYVLELDGYVCGAAYDDNFGVHHIIIDKESDLGRIRGSKYMQSSVSSLFPKIKILLEQKKYVLFTGMPCQVSGLYAYLGRDYDTLYTIDLVCHGISSSKVFEKYHNEVLEGKKLIRLEFKEKEPWGWHAGVNAYFEDGTKYSKPLETDPYFKSYLQSLSKNVACAECTSNRMPRQGDLTIGDFWRIEVFKKDLNDNKGTSLVLVNNEKGKVFFNNLKKIFAIFEKAPLNIAISGNRSLQHSYPMHKNRDVFFKNFNELPFDALQVGCLNNRLYEQKYLELIKHVPCEDHELYFIAKFAAEHAHGRSIVTWIRSKRFEDILKKYFGLTVKFGVSQRREALIKDYIEDFNMLRGKWNRYYLVSLDRAYDESVYKLLAEFGYRPEKDFIFRIFKPIILENLDLSKGNYYDAFGNSIEGFRSSVGKIILRGFNNHIMFANNMDTARFLTFNLCANTIIDIGERVRFNAPATIESIEFNYSTKLKIGNGCAFNEGGLFRFAPPASAIIGENCTAASKFDLHASMGKKIIIGRDCMFSYENQIWAGDAHSIFDVKSGSCINRNISEKYRPSNNLVIGNHVWVGKQAFLLHGTNIGSGSIVGARSMVKGIFPNNCTIAGNPAQKRREDVAWSGGRMDASLASCGRPEYAVLTSHARAPISGHKVLVIGGTRFMGVQLVRELLALGNEVTIATRGKTKDNFGMYVNRLVMDVSNAESVKAALKGKYFDVVFDNLAYCSLYANNVLSHVSCGKYVQISSVESYVNLTPDLKEEQFNPYRLAVELCNISSGYVKGKRQAESIVYQNHKNTPAVTVRIPYVTKTDRLLYYCKNIVKQIPMKIDDVSRGFTFIRDTEVGKFLPWIAAQNFTGPINLASEGMVTIKMILDYIEAKTGKKAVIDEVNGAESPFHAYNEKTFSMNMEKAQQLGYRTSKINDWFWKLMDEYIAQAIAMP